jgi:hypothetical protein
MVLAVSLGEESTMASSLLELILFSLPSLFYERALRRRESTSAEARAAVGWRVGDYGTYGLAIAVSAVPLPITY